MPRPDFTSGHDHELTASDHYAATAINANVQRKASTARIEGMREGYNAHLSNFLASGKQHDQHGVIFPGHPKYHEAGEIDRG